MIKIGRGDLGAAAAKLYREFGEEEKCAEYFEKSEEPNCLLYISSAGCEGQR